MIDYQEIVQRAKSSWEMLSRTGKGAVVATPFLVFGLFVILLLAGDDNYVAICEDQKDRSVVFSLIDGLEQEDIPYKLTDGGHSVHVPLDSFARAASIYTQSVSRQSQSSRNEETSFFSNPLFGGAIANKNSDIRMREKHLARNISCYKGVRNARVMITPPDTRVFARKEHKEARASVFLELSSDQPVSPCRIEGIKQLVAAGYHGLSEDKVSITDSIGTDYALIANQLAQTENEKASLEQQKLERQVQEKVQRHLAVMLGNQNVSVAASISLKRERNQKKRSIDNLCLSVFVNEAAQGYNRWSPEVRESLVKNISSVARINRKRGDTVSVLVVPFDESDKLPHKGAKPPVIVSMSNKTNCASQKPFVLSQSATELESGPVLLSTANLLDKGQSHTTDYPIAPLMISLVLCCGFCLIFFVRRRGSDDGDDHDLWHPVSGFEFAEVEGTYCSLSDYPPLHGNEEMLYKEEVVSRTALEEPDVIASLIRRNEHLKNSDW